VSIISRDGYWVIIHGGREVAETFESEQAAWAWADEFVDDQVFGSPNRFAPPLVYRELANGTVH
jgi:hypothetical protein